jgi:glycerophosphoryl diester phosphodiesterase
MRPLLIGHRGAPGHYPEHTRSGYLAALAMGADAVEPDIVVSGDGVLVVRHENELSATTDVSERPEFADRRTTKRWAGYELTGWFTEDFTWEELSVLRCRERMPRIRSASAARDGQEGMLRLVDLIALLEDAAPTGAGPVRMVLEIKLAAYFAAIGRDPVALLERELRATGWWQRPDRLIVEAFEPDALDRLRSRGLAAPRLQLLAADPSASRPDLPEGWETPAAAADGISVDKAVLLERGRDLVAAAHARGLLVYAWTCRPENRFLAPRFRRGEDPAAPGDYAAEWQALRETGLDGVFVDHPDLGAAIFR